MTYARHTYYENKSLVRLKGLAQCLGLEIVSADWDSATRTMTLGFNAPKARCQEFIDGASVAIRKAHYAHVAGGVAVTFARATAEARTLQGTQTSA